tara:strand:+ start:375 stop:824 length:450 start_codon:yes stop_codon:yes gene_type:complete
MAQSSIDRHPKRGLFVLGELVEAACEFFAVQRGLLDARFVARNIWDFQNGRFELSDGPVLVAALGADLPLSIDNPPMSKRCDKRGFAPLARIKSVRMNPQFQEDILNRVFNLRLRTIKIPPGQSPDETAVLSNAVFGGGLIAGCDALED